MKVEHTKTERNVLGYVKHPFIVGLNMAFQTKDKLFFVLDYCAGGELFFHLVRVVVFTGWEGRGGDGEYSFAGDVGVKEVSEGTGWRLAQHLGSGILLWF